MRYMHWSWRDYCDVPEVYRLVLIEMVHEERRHMQQERDRAERRGRR